MQNRTRVAYVLFQTCPGVCLWGEDAVSVGLLGSPFLAGSASCSDGHFAPIVFTIPRHAVCRKKEIMCPWVVQA